MQGRRFLFLPLHPSAFRSGSTVRSGFPNHLEFSSQPVHSFIEFPFLEIRLIEERICSSFYLGMSHNGCAVHPYQLLVFRREHPVPITDTMPVSRGNPPLVLLWVPSFSPSPQQFVQDIVQMRERITCAYGLVVISPTSNLFIQLHNQNILLPRFSSAENRVRDIGNDSLNRLLGRLIISFSLYFLKFQPRKSKPSSMLVTTVFSSEVPIRVQRETLESAPLLQEPVQVLPL